MDANANADNQPPLSFGAEPYAFSHDDLLNFALHTHANNQAAPSWMPHDNDSYVTMMLQPPPADPKIKEEPPHSPLLISVPATTTTTNSDKGNLRRSARIAATPHRVLKQPVSPATPSTFAGSTPTTVGLTSGEDDDDNDDESGNEARAPDVDKRERRRQQVREASSRRRLKLKAEDVFLTKRVQELDAHMAILHARFPQLVPPPTPSTVMPTPPNGPTKWTEPRM